MSDEIQALHERIAKARAERAGLDEAAEKRAEIARLERLAKAEEQALLDAPHIAEAEATHGVDRTEVVVTDLGAIVVKRPNHLKFNALLAKGDKMTQLDMTNLVRSCVVYPTWPETDKILEELPATLGILVEVVVGLAGASKTERSGK